MYATRVLARIGGESGQTDEPDRSSRACVLATGSPPPYDNVDRMPFAIEGGLHSALEGRFSGLPSASRMDLAGHEVRFADRQLTRIPARLPGNHRRDRIGIPAPVPGRRLRIGRE